jgi:hypothetical protein
MANLSADLNIALARYRRGQRELFGIWRYGSFGRGHSAGIGSSTTLEFWNVSSVVSVPVSSTVLTQSKKCGRRDLT